MPLFQLKFILSSFYVLQTNVCGMSSIAQIACANKKTSRLVSEFLANGDFVSADNLRNQFGPRLD